MGTKKEEWKMLNTTNLTREQKKGLKELGRILYGNNTKFDFEPLESHPELIEKEWVSKKGTTFVKVNGTQLEKASLKYYSVDMNTGTIHHTGALTK